MGRHAKLRKCPLWGQAQSGSRCRHCQMGENHPACEPGLNPDPQSLRTGGAGVPEGMSQGCLYGLGTPATWDQGLLLQNLATAKAGRGLGVRGLHGQEVVWVRQGGTGRKQQGSKTGSIEEGIRSFSPLQPCLIPPITKPLAKQKWVMQGPSLNTTKQGREREVGTKWREKNLIPDTKWFISNIHPYIWKGASYMFRLQEKHHFQALTVR